MIRKSLNTQVNERLKEGLSKQEIYTELISNYQDEEVRSTLASKPSFEAREKLKIKHKIVSGFWILAFSLGFLMNMEILTHLEPLTFIYLITFFFLMYQLCKFNGNLILPGMIWLTWGMVEAFQELAFLNPFEPDRELTITVGSIYILISVFIVHLMFDIRKTAFPHYKWFRPKKDGEGQIQFEH